MDFSGLGPALTLLGTFGGVWVVVLLFRWLQSDFVKTYRAELEEVREDLATARRELDAERILRQHAENRAALFQFELTRHGLPTPTVAPPPPIPEEGSSDAP